MNQERKGVKSTVGELQHDLLGMMLGVVYRFHSGLRDEMISEILGRVKEKGYIDQLSQDELELLPKRFRRQTFYKINMEFITQRYQTGRVV